MSDTRVADSSALILLAKAGLTRLLPSGGYRLVVPETVIAEVNAGDEGDPARTDVQRMLDGGDITMDATPVPPAVLDFDLGAGESAVLATALRFQSQGLTVTAVLDDRQARGAARTLGVTATGVVGVLLQAKESRLIQSFRVHLHELLGAGMWLDDALCRRAALSVGEDWP